MPLATFGNAKNAPQGQVGRSCAMRRLRASKLIATGRRPPTYVPRYLLQMQPDQGTRDRRRRRRNRRLYLYRNDKGRPRFVADYYISQGKLGADKTREGDKRTPIGVYHVHLQPVAAEARRPLRQRRLPDQLPPTSGTVARDATGTASGCTARLPTHLLTAAQGFRRLRRAVQRRSQRAGPRTCKSA